MKNTIILSLAFILILIGSCRKKLDIDLPEGSKHIVVNGIITQDSLIKVNISKSQNALDNDTIPSLTDATVKLFEDDIFVENLVHTGTGNYISSITTTLNKDYKITVDYDKLQSVTANMELTPAVPILSIDTTIGVSDNWTYGDGEGNVYYLGKSIDFEITINDNANESNFYFLAINMMLPSYEYVNDTMLYVGLTERSLYFDSDDLVFRNKNSSFDMNNIWGQAFTDEIFNGLQYTIDGSADFFIEDFDDIDTPNTFPIIVKLLTINQDIYRYIRSYNLNEETEYDPFAQPVQIFTNVENGLGLFSGYTMHVDTLVLESN